MVANSLCKKRCNEIVDRRAVVGQDGPAAAAERIIDVALRDAYRAFRKLKFEVSGDDDERRLDIAATVTLAQGGGANTNPSSIGSATGGAGAGKIKFNEFTIKKTTDKTSPIFSNSGRQFIWFDDVAKFFGVTTTINCGTLAPGAPINLHVAPNPGAAIAVGDVTG